MIGYHSWIYEKVLNTEWFMWIIVYATLGISVFSPLIAWYFTNGKKVIAKFRELRKQR